LSVADVKALRNEFCQNYPGELLLPSTMPSLSFLCLLKESIETNNFAWIPWKSRTSEADEQIFLEHRRPRNDRQLLRSLLSEGEAVLNEQPEATINHQAPVEVVLGKFQSLLTIALAMLSSAHLIVLKRFHAKFMEIAVAKPRDQHLRAPSLSEILDADRTAWSAVTELLYDSKWSLNDVLNEIAFCRQVFHTSLAPRPKPLQQPKPENPKRRPDLPKPLPKKIKQDDTPTDAPKPQPATPKGAQWDKTWVRKLRDGKGICMRFNSISTNANPVRHVGLLMSAQYPKQMGSRAQGLTQRHAINRRHTDQHCLWMPIRISHRSLLINAIQFNCQRRVHQVWKLQFPNL